MATEASTIKVDSEALEYSTWHRPKNKEKWKHC